MATGSQIASPTTASRHWPWRGDVGSALALSAVWLVLILVTAVYRPDFLSHQTLLAVSFTMSIVGVLALAQAFVVISGGFLDLSQPTGVILSGLMIVKLAEAGLSLPFLLAAAIATGACWGLFNAAIIVLARLNPVIVTLATNFIGLACLFLVFQLAQVPLGSDIHTFGRAGFLGLPAIWWPMTGLILIAGFFLPRTRVGRRTIAVGGNREAARARGISLARTRLATFALSGATVGFAAVLFVASSGSFNPASANTLQLNVIASVILAGISLAGGRGSLWTLFPSVGFLSTIPTTLVFFGLASDAQLIFQGIILIVAVAIDGYRARRTP